MQVGYLPSVPDRPSNPHRYGRSPRRQNSSGFRRFRRCLRSARRHPVHSRGRIALLGSGRAATDPETVARFAQMARRFVEPAVKL
jgi:hypothetical protein